MEVRNGIIHIKVTLKSLSQVREPVKPTHLAKRPQKRVSSHKPALSLTIPSETSPRLVQIKENIASNKPKQQKMTKENVNPMLAKKVQSSSMKILNKTSREKVNRCIRPSGYYANLCSIPTNIEEISSQIDLHSRKSSFQSVLPRRKPASFIKNVKT